MAKKSKMPPAFMKKGAKPPAKGGKADMPMKGDPAAMRKARLAGMKI